MGGRQKPVRVPPRWFVHAAWRIHRGLHRVTRRGLWTPASKRGWGALRLTTTGRRTGRPRTVIVAYLEEGPDLVLLAMNGWQEGEPAWWLNLQADPSARVRLADGKEQDVTAQVARGDDRERLWNRWRAIPRLDEYSALRSTTTAVVVLTPTGLRENV